MAAVFTISGGTALMMAAFATRLSPCRRQIVHHLAAAGGVADVNGVLQIEMRRQSRKVVGIVIHVMAVARSGWTGRGRGGHGR